MLSKLVRSEKYETPLNVENPDSLVAARSKIKFLRSLVAILSICLILLLWVAFFRNSSSESPVAFVLSETLPTNSLPVANQATTSIRSSTNRFEIYQSRYSGYLDETHVQGTNYSIPKLPYSYDDPGKVIFECFKDKFLLFIGDSRLRFLFVEFVKAANESKLEDPSFPHNENCPFEEPDVYGPGWQGVCSSWFKGVDCDWWDCERDFTRRGLRMHYSFKRNLLPLGIPILNESWGKPDFLFYIAGAWDVYEKLTIEDPSPAYRSIKSIDAMSLAFPDIMKIYVAYPECPNEERLHIPVDAQGIINRAVREHLSGRKDWIFFQFPRPNIARWCEGFHIRYEWTELEFEVLASTLCEKDPEEIAPLQFRLRNERLGGFF